MGGGEAPASRVLRVHLETAIWKQGVDWSAPQDQFGNFYSTRGPLSHPRRLRAAHQKSFRRQAASARANKEESYFLFFVRAPLINPPPPPPQPTKTIPAQILLCMFYSGRRRFVLCAAEAAVVNKFIKVTYGVNLLYGGFFGPCLVRVKENERRRERRERAKAASQRKQLGGNFPRRICIK
jgi:hypothetical protein